MTDQPHESPKHCRSAVRVVAPIAMISAFLTGHWTPLFLGVFAIYLTAGKQTAEDDETGCLGIVQVIYGAFLVFLVCVAVVVDFTPLAATIPLPDINLVLKILAVVVLAVLIAAQILPMLLSFL